VTGSVVVPDKPTLSAPPVVLRVLLNVMVMLQVVDTDTCIRYSTVCDAPCFFGTPDILQAVTPQVNFRVTRAPGALSRTVASALSAAVSSGAGM
jgi:hypothetical protein